MNSGIYARNILVQAYQAYCYDTIALQDDANCDLAIWPESYT